MKMWYRFIVTLVGLYIMVMYASYLLTYVYAWDTFEKSEPQWIDSLAAVRVVLDYPAVLWFGKDTTTILMPLCNALVWSLGTCLIIYTIVRLLRSRRGSN